jgi:hypothetical protein
MADTPEQNEPSVLIASPGAAAALRAAGEKRPIYDGQRINGASAVARDRLATIRHLAEAYDLPVDVVIEDHLSGWAEQRERELDAAKWAVAAKAAKGPGMVNPAHATEYADGLLKKNQEREDADAAAALERAMAEIEAEAWE